MVDRQIDELYQLPLAEFTAARNALAKTLSGDDAARVKRLEKPTVVPWAINQVYWRNRAVYERLLKTGAALRDAQIASLEGRKADVTRASAAHRQALADAVARATEHAAAHGSQPGVDALSRMLEALSVAPERPEQPGRFTDLVQPAGFEALTGVTPKAVASPRTSRAEQGEKKEPSAKQNRTRQIQVDRAAVRRAAAEQKRKDARITAAERVLERARAAEATVRRALAQAEQDARDAEAALARAKGR